MRSSYSTLKYPPIHLLSGDGWEFRDVSLEDAGTAETLMYTVAAFGIWARLQDINHGPTVTRFDIKLGDGVSISKVRKIADDIALALRVGSVRIDGPIPGKGVVGIEVPNAKRDTVTLGAMLRECTKTSPTTVALGRDNAGEPIFADLADLPHLLIAGQTGSGKSVCINTLITSILYRATPSDVKMILIDPKMVELTGFNGVPHLLMPVITDTRKATQALKWAVDEMSDRYAKLAKAGVRNIDSYNKLPDVKKLPRIVILIDELADLMMTSAKDTEQLICRIAQLARAAGMHLVIATQRPTVNVLTGLIKANIPARIAFAVTSGTDSRVILDQNGAEKLLGKGDMLYNPTGCQPIRIQGAFTSDEEVERTVTYIRGMYR